MKYLKLFKIMPADLLFNGNKEVDWEFFGFDPKILRRLTVHGNIDKDIYVMCLPIFDETKLNSKMALLGSRVEATPVETDSISIITEAEKDAVKAQIEAYRASIIAN